MLRKRYRLPIAAYVGRRGEARTAPHFMLKIFPPASAFPRVGIVIKRGVAPNAASRNALRRRASRLVEAHWRDLPLRDFLLLVRVPLPAARDSSIEREFTDLVGLPRRAPHSPRYNQQPNPCRVKKKEAPGKLDGNPGLEAGL